MKKITVDQAARWAHAEYPARAQGEAARDEAKRAIIRKMIEVIE